MDITYKILWFEDTDEWFETLGRRIQRYIGNKNLLCQIDRIYSVDQFDLSKYNMQEYDMFIVDLRLADSGTGTHIINTIRNADYVNDILFYSSEGAEQLSEILKENRMEGVFITDRNHKSFMSKAERLIDKAVRRAENIINIRGIVMDETSEFDNQMGEFIYAAFQKMSPQEQCSIKDYVNGLLAKKEEDTISFIKRYSSKTEWSVSDVLCENEFTSMMRAKLLNYILNMNNELIHRINEQGQQILPELYTGKKVKFVAKYDKEILWFRNHLAHVKKLNAGTEILIAERDGKQYFCNEEFCTMMRAKLIQYRDWFNTVYNILIS